MNQTTGDAERFRQVAAEYEKASQVNRRRLYVETLQSRPDDSRQMKAHIATAILVAALAAAVLWKQQGIAAPQPQDPIYQRLDAVRDGSFTNYIDAHTGSMKASLLRAAAEIGEARLLQSLRDQNASLKGIAVLQPGFPVRPGSQSPSRIHLRRPQRDPILLSRKSRQHLENRPSRWRPANPDTRPIRHTR
jgi:hypothetical protein